MTMKLRDLTVMDLDLQRGPDVIAWGAAPNLIVQGMPIMGFEGDHYYGPASAVDAFSEWTDVAAALDPSGRGGDETALSIGAELHGRLFLLFNGGWRDGYSPATLKAIASAIVFYRVKRLRVEDNFGDGMFVSLLTPYVNQAWKEFNDAHPSSRHGGTEIEGIRSQRTQKEIRMLSILEPLTQSHRLVVAKRVIEDDYKSLSKIDGDDLRDKYSLFYQFSHVTRERDSLLHDDRVESLAILGSMFSEMLGINPWDSAARREEDRMAEELEKLLGEGVEVGGESDRSGASSSQRPGAVRSGPSRTRVH